MIWRMIINKENNYRLENWPFFVVVSYVCFDICLNPSLITYKHNVFIFPFPFFRRTRLRNQNNFLLSSNGTLMDDMTGRNFIMNAVQLCWKLFSFRYNKIRIMNEINLIRTQYTLFSCNLWPNQKVFRIVKHNINEREIKKKNQLSIFHVLSFWYIVDVHWAMCSSFFRP